MALKEQAATVFSLGSKATFPECSSVSEHTICASIRPDPKLLAALDLSTLITDQQFVDELNSLIEAQWQRLFGLFTISID